ncbi:MAG: hypothetical protein ABEK01_03475 [Candidatus Nanohaloarchaea archaeon]
MRSLSDHGLMSFRASTVYFAIIQGFGFLLGMEYTAFQLFGITTAGVVMFNIWALMDSRLDLPDYLSGCGSYGFMDERELELVTTAAAYGFIAAVFAASLDQGGVYSLGAYQVARAGYAVFLGVFLAKTFSHRYGHLLR